MIPDKKHVLFFAGRCELFFSAWSLVLFFLFLLSNYQQFLESNQRLIMNLLSLALLANLGIGLFWLFFLLYPGAALPPPRRRRVAFVLVTSILSLLLFLILEFFYAWLSF